MKNKIKIALNVLGALIILGTAGSSDLDRISFAQTIIQCFIGVACIAVTRIKIRGEKNEN